MIKNLNKKNKKKGFTLIELIIVIAIIAILAAVAIPKFGEVRKNANIKTDIANAKTIANAATTLIAEEKLAVDKDYIIGDTAATALNDYLQSAPKGKAGNLKGKSFIVKVDENGGVKVLLDDSTDVEVYPNATGDYAK